MTRLIFKIKKILSNDILGKSCEQYLYAVYYTI